MFKKTKNFFYYFIVIVFIFLYEYIFLYISNKIKKFFIRFNFYQNLLNFFSKSYIRLISFFILILAIAEIFAIIGGYFILKKKIIIGTIFYSIKLILFVPVSDIFSKNKKLILKINFFKNIYFYYILVKHLIKMNKYFKIIKKYLTSFKMKIKKYITNLKEKFILKFK